MGQCLHAADPKVRELHVQQARHYEPGDSDNDLDETLVEELTDLRASGNALIENDAQLPVRSLTESRPVLANTILPGSHPDTVPTKSHNTCASDNIVTPNSGLPISDKKAENQDIVDDGYFSPLERIQLEIDLFAGAGKTPRLATPRIGESTDELRHRAMNAIDSIKMNHSSEIRWKKGELVGSGAFGSVYVGLDEGRGQLIAIKEVPIVTLGAEVTKRIRELQKEIRLMGRLAHKNIVRYLGTDRVTNFFCILMEYVPGGSIAAVVKQFGCLSETVTRGYTKQILDGLHYLHCHRIVHRDIKGANILTTKSGVIKLADFGSSKGVADLVETGSGNVSLRGTPYWMAPEVIRQVSTGRQADIWSLGATIIEMSTGKPPWSEHTTQVTALFQIAVATEPPTFPEGFSDDGKDFLNLCFKRQPKERPNALALSRHKFITTEVPSATISLESKSEQVTGAAATSDHAHDENANTKDKLKLNLGTQTDTKDLEPTKHRFTGPLHVANSKSDKLKETTTVGTYTTRATKTADNSAVSTGKIFERKVTDASEDLDSEPSMSDEEFSDCNDLHEPSTIEIVPKRSKIGPKSRTRGGKQKAPVPKLQTNAALLSSSPSERSPIHQRATSTPSHVRQTRSPPRKQREEKREHTPSKSKHDNESDSDSDTCDNVRKGDRKAGAVASSASPSKEMTVKTDSPTTGPRHFGRKNRVSPIPPINFPIMWKPAETLHDETATTGASGKSDNRQVRRQRHRQARRSPAIKGVARHRKPMVKDVFNFGAEDVSLADAEADRSSNVTALRRATPDSSAAKSTDEIAEAEASQKSNFVSKKRKTSSAKQKHKRTFKENRVSPECNQVDSPPAATTDDAAANEEGYEGPWKLRSLAPINLSRVTPSVDGNNPTSRTVADAKRLTDAEKSRTAKASKSSLLRAMFHSPRVKKKKGPDKKKRVLTNRKGKKEPREGTSSARVNDRSVEGKDKGSEAEIAAAVASGGFKGEVCL